MKKYDDIMIDIELEEPSRSSPALGHVDKLLRQSALETQSLQVVRRMMMRDMLDRAQVTGVTKLTAAAGVRDKQRQFLLEETTSSNGNGHEPKPRKVYKKGKHRVTRQSRESRVTVLREYLALHPGQDTNTIGAGLGWRPQMVQKLAHDIATMVRQPGSRQAGVWTLKGSKGAKAAKSARKVKRKSPAERRPREERQQEVRSFLEKNPEAFTRDIAKALQFKPNSHFVKILRTIARPVRPTLKTQPIQWVLSA